MYKPPRLWYPIAAAQADGDGVMRGLCRMNEDTQSESYKRSLDLLEDGVTAPPAHGAAMTTQRASAAESSGKRLPRQTPSERRLSLSLSSSSPGPRLHTSTIPQGALWKRNLLLTAEPGRHQPLLGILHTHLHLTELILTQGGAWRWEDDDPRARPGFHTPSSIALGRSLKMPRL